MIITGKAKKLGVGLELELYQFTKIKCHSSRKYIKKISSNLIGRDRKTCDSKWLILANLVIDLTPRSILLDTLSYIAKMFKDLSPWLLYNFEIKSPIYELAIN